MTPTQQERPPIQLRAWRLYRNVTQAELAERSGVSEWQLSRYENQRTTPQPAALTKLATALGTEPWRLYTVPEAMTGIVEAAERRPRGE